MEPETAVETLIARHAGAADTPGAIATAGDAADLAAGTRPDVRGGDAGCVHHLTDMPRLIAAMGTVPADIRPHIAFGTPWSHHGLWQSPGIAGPTLTALHLAAALRRQLAGDPGGRLRALAAALLDAARIEHPGNADRLAFVLAGDHTPPGYAGAVPELNIHAVGPHEPALTMTVVLAIDDHLAGRRLAPVDELPDHHVALVVSPSGRAGGDAPGWRDVTWGQVLAAWETHLAAATGPALPSTPAFHRLRGILWRRTLAPPPPSPAAPRP